MNFAVENWASFVNDARPCFPIHWEELALDKDKFKMVLYESRYEFAEKEGCLHVVTARDNGRIVGYYVGAILPHLHYAEAGNMASTDMYFLLPEYRTGTNGFKFVDFIEQSLRERGAVKIYISCKVHRDLQRFWEALGYTFSDKMFVKVLA